MNAFSMRLVLTIIAAVFFTACTGAKRGVPIPADYQPREGDFLFQSLPHNPIIDAIEGCTESPFSHCGIVVDRAGKWHVIEAIGPVRETPLPVWIAQGRNNKYVAFRLRAPLDAKVPAIIAAARKYKGRPYDIRYDFDDEKIYCSELMWKAVRDATGAKLGEIKTLGDLKWQPYEKVIRELENGGLPLERKMITPRALSEAPELQEVYRFRM